MSPPGGLSRCLRTQDGVISLDIPDGVLPGFLIEAFNAAQVPDLDKANGLLTDQNLALAMALIDRGAAEPDVIRLVVAMTLQRIGRLDQALDWYQHIVEPNALVLNELSVIYKHLGQVEQAIVCQDRALGLDPDNAGLWSNLATDLMRTGRSEEGLALLRRAVDRCPGNACIHSDLLFMMHYVPGLDRRTIFEEHRRWGLRHAPLSRARIEHDNDPAPDRRLRIGYLSADLRMHSVVYTFEPLLDGHDHRAFEIHGYANVSRPDAVTQRLTEKFDRYHNIHGLDDRAVVDQIEHDRIDILVAVAGHAGENRLTVLGYKPAPVQVDLGSLATLGMEQVDARLTDVIFDPPQDRDYYIEDLEYLPGGYFSFRPPDLAPDVGPLPLLRNKFVTFGSFNSPQKMNGLVLGLWASVLKAVKDSRLVLKFSGGNDPWVKGHFQERFERLGIGPNRIEICGWRPLADHLSLYNQVDVALDTYPFNGCVTTLEGLWMGVPILTLTGPQFLSRAGWTILHRLGMEGLVAANPHDYVAKAVALAGNGDALSRIRASLRPRMRNSPLCDAHRFAREVEAAYRRMWHRWCDAKGTRREASIKTEDVRS
jgi:protein O-GlcNAc transferase